LSGVVLDTGALIGWERADRAVTTLVAGARRKKVTLTIPAGCGAQTWRDPRRQARLAALVRDPNVDVVAMNVVEAQKVGLLLADTGTSDITDAHGAVCALRLEAAVVTSDPEDIRQRGPGLRIHRV